jgi:hypothetical protein
MNLRIRAGTSLVELLAVMSLAAMVIGVIAGIFSAQLRLARATARRAADSEAVRTVTSVLPAEMRRIAAGDVRAFAEDSIAIRAFRGIGLPCGATQGGTLVRYRGDRLPDPEKDSVLAAALDPEIIVPLLGSTTAAGMCTGLPGETVLEWTMADPGTAAVLLVFEAGSYHLSGRALRYRIGAGGRQPLTDEALLHPYSRFTAVGVEGVRFQVQAGDRRATFSAPFASSPP